MSWFVLIAMLIGATKRGLLIAGLQYFESWTLVVSLRRRKWSNEEIDLGASFRNAI